MTQTPVSAGTRLADLTTLRLGGPVADYRPVDTRDALIDAVREADAREAPLLVLGGGSNLVVGDQGFGGTVVHVMTRGIELESADRCGGGAFTVAAGHPWDDVVVFAVQNGFMGIEALSGIPGSTGATPLQNVGAYGQEVAGGIALVRTWDRLENRVRTLANADCRFGYRTSLLKTEKLRGGPRYVVLDVQFQLRVADLGAPVRYAELARALGVEPGARVPLADVRAAVLSLRAGKGMVLDAADHDTWSAGSFFTNPVLPVSFPLPEGAPRYPAEDGFTKTSAAWLIEHAGFSRGHGLPGPVSLSTKHTLALTNRGDASTADLLRLAHEVRDGVELSFGLRLEPEPVLVGCAL